MNDHEEKHPIKAGVPPVIKAGVPPVVKSGPGGKEEDLKKPKKTSDQKDSSQENKSNQEK